MAIRLPTGATWRQHEAATRHLCCGCQWFDTSALLQDIARRGEAGQRCLVACADDVETCFASPWVVPLIPPSVVLKFRGCRSVAGALPAPSAANASEASMLSDRESQFLTERRIAHLATADQGAIPHVVPVCFVLVEPALYITIDQKPKRGPVTALKRLRNIAENPRVAIVVDHYEEDWARLGWVMLQGRAEILAPRPRTRSGAGLTASPIPSAERHAHRRSSGHSRPHRTRDELG